jgi:hypothetical protein
LSLESSDVDGEINTWWRRTRGYVFEPMAG